MAKRKATIEETPEGEFIFETRPSSGKRVTFDQVDNAFAEVPYLVPKLKYWGQVWILDVTDPTPGAEHPVIYESKEVRDYREVIEFGIYWVKQGHIRTRLKEQHVPLAAIDAAEKTALIALNRELQNGK